MLLLILTLTIDICSEYYKEYADPWRPGLAYNAKLPHILPQGGISGETEYEDRYCHNHMSQSDTDIVQRQDLIYTDHDIICRYVPKRSSDGRVMPRWYTWQGHHLRSPFGLSAKNYDKPSSGRSRSYDQYSRQRPQSYSDSFWYFEYFWLVLKYNPDDSMVVRCSSLLSLDINAHLKCVSWDQNLVHWIPLNI